MEIDQETKPDDIDPSTLDQPKLDPNAKLTPMQEMAAALKAAKVAKAQEEERKKKEEELSLIHI